MPKRITKTCPECNATFDVVPSQAARRVYCSMACKRAVGARTLATQVCPQCEKPFSFHPSVYRNGRVHCSKACEKAAARTTAICPTCGKEFWYHRKWKRVHCSVACAGKGRAEQRRGIPQPHAHRAYPERKRQVALVCEICSKPFSVQTNESKGRRFCSNACKAKWQETALAGSSNNNWQGGEAVYYYGPNWRAQRRNARHRDNYACQRCGATEDQLGKQLDVHHIKPFGHFGLEFYQDANRLANLVSLCVSCHLTVEHEQGTRPNPWDFRLKNS